jgi:3-methyl-2-oxobutanoate hydroxymethyltransferase
LPIAFPFSKNYNPKSFMSSHSTNGNLAKVTVPAVRAAKERGEKLTCLTAYDYPTARVVDEAGVEIILVGDSAGNVVFGYDNTIPVTMEEMLFAAKAVRHGVKRALLVADMPYGSYHVSTDETVHNALRFIKEGGAEAVKLEGGRNRLEIIKRLVNEEIPVMGHIGLTPQSFNKLGGYRLQAKTSEAAQALLDDAKALEDAGVFSIVLELVPRELARIVTETVKISTIGIGAGAECDVQVLVLHDLLGLTFGKQPKFVRKYANLRETMTEAIQKWTADVKNGEYPNKQESYGLPNDVQLAQANKG